MKVQSILKQTLTEHVSDHQTESMLMFRPGPVLVLLSQTDGLFALHQSVASRGAVVSCFLGGYSVWRSYFSTFLHLFRPGSQCQDMSTTVEDK